MAKLWKTKRAGSIGITVNGETHTYYADAIDAEHAAPKTTGQVDLGSKSYYATGVSFDVPQIDQHVADFGDAVITDNLIASNLILIEDHTVVML